MKENIYLIGSFFGLNKNQIRGRFKDIIEFSGLEKFVNTKVYQFSEGMKQRLAFSIAINCNPEILLLDEVFEVGDEEFRRKSSEKIKELVEKGAGVILVSQNLDMIKKYCDRALFLHNGKIVKDGNVKKVLREYTSFESEKDELK